MTMEIITSTGKRIAYAWQEFNEFGTDKAALTISGEGYAWRNEWLASAIYSPSAGLWYWNACKAGFGSPLHVRLGATSGKGEARTLSAAKRACEKVLA